MQAPETLEKRIKEIEDGKFEEGFKELMSLSEKELKERYVARDFIDQKKA